jgi:hypothetical protein
MQYQPNNWALENVHTRLERFITGVTCRQSGKTEAAAIQIFNELHEPPSLVGNNLRPPEVGIISFDFPHAMKAVERFTAKMAEFFPGKFRQNVNEHRIWLPESGAVLQALSSDNPHSMAGHTFSSVIVDEGQFVPDEAMAILRPTLSVREARMFSFGTPQVTPYQSWFRASYLRGLDDAPDYNDYHSFTVSSENNRWISAKDLKLAKESETERNFRMLYKGEWVDSEGSVFHAVDEAVRGTELEQPKKDVKYVMAVDFAATEDYNVVLIAERATRHVVKMYRWNRQGTVPSLDRIETIHEQWNEPVAWGDESNGLGFAMLEQMRLRGIRCRPIKFNASNKMAIINRLAANIEHLKITFAEIPQLIRELKAYSYEQTRSGKLTANAPAGYHDDCVAALMIMNEALGRSKPSSRGVAQDNWLVNQPMKRKVTPYA